LPGRRSVEAQDCCTIRLSIIVRLAVGFLEVLGSRIEGEQLLEQSVVGSQLNHGAPCLVPTNDIAAVEQVVEQRSGLSAGIKGQSGDGHRLSLMLSRSTIMRKNRVGVKGTLSYRSVRHHGWHEASGQLATRI
jgi:hypothetical protein